MSLYGYERDKAERAGHDAFRDRRHDEHYSHQADSYGNDYSEAYCYGWRQEERRDEERQEQEAYDARCERQRHEQAEHSKMDEEAQWEEQQEQQRFIDGENQGEPWPPEIVS